GRSRSSGRQGGATGLGCRDSISRAGPGSRVLGVVGVVGIGVTRARGSRSVGVDFSSIGAGLECEGKGVICSLSNKRGNGSNSEPGSMGSRRGAAIGAAEAIGALASTGRRSGAELDSTAGADMDGRGEAGAGAEGAIAGAEAGAIAWVAFR